MVGKLDPQAVKCVFVGYASTQKGYKCWDPIGKRLFVSMDVTFREEEPYYTKKVTWINFWMNSLRSMRVTVERGRMEELMKVVA